jgi:hypothetical protein
METMRCVDSSRLGERFRNASRDQLKNVRGVASSLKRDGVSQREQGVHFPFFSTIQEQGPPPIGKAHCHAAISFADIDSRVDIVVIRDRELIAVLNEIDDWTVQKLLGTLTDEPTSFEELCTRVRIFGDCTTLVPKRLEQATPMNLVAMQEQCDGKPSWVWIDLVARMVVQWLPVFHPGLYQSTDELTGKAEIVYTLLPPDWRLESVSSLPEWFVEMQVRACRYHSPVVFDSREMLFGRPLLEYLAECFVERKQPNWRTPRRWESVLAAERNVRDSLQKYLGLPLPGTEGRALQSVLSESRWFVDQACQYRRELWIHTGHPPLPRLSAPETVREERYGSVQYGIFVGLAEYIMDKMLQRIDEVGYVSDSKEEVVDVMDQLREEFLHGLPVGSAWRHQELIDIERAYWPVPVTRVPLWNGIGLDFDKNGQQAMLLSATMVPRFQEINFLESRVPLRPIAHNPMVVATERERSYSHVIADENESCLGSAQGVFAEQEVDEFASVWKHSYLNWDAQWPSESSFSFLAMRLSFLVSEILMELRQAHDDINSVRLIEQFSYLRLASESEVATIVAYEAELFCQVLEEMTSSHPGLVSRLADIQSRLWEQIQRLTAQ